MYADMLLPANAVLLHVGPHKTGTSAIQSMLWSARNGLRQAGVWMSDRRSRYRYASYAIVGAGLRFGEKPSSDDEWDELVRGVTAAADRRAVISSETLCQASPAAIDRIVEDLGGDRVEVVITARPLTHLLPSAYQQYVRSGARFTYDRWLEGVLRTPPYDQPTPSFWTRYRYDELVGRWAAAIGAARITMLMVHPDRALLPRSFEAMLGLPEGLLSPDPIRLNRSLSYAETELVRYINRRRVEQEWPPEVHHDFVRMGVTPRVQQSGPPRSEPIRTPQWAIDRAAEIGTEMADRLAGSGITVVGDIATLGTTEGARTGDNDPAQALPIEAAGEAVIGAIVASGVLAPPDPPPPPASELRSRELLRIVARRIRRAVGRRLRRAEIAKR